MSKQNTARIILGVLIFAFSFLTWYFLDSAFSAIGDWPVLILPPMLAFLILGAATGILYLFEESQGMLILLPAGLIWASFAAFLSGFGKQAASSELVLAAVGFASFLLFVAGAKNSRLEKSLRLKIIVPLILRKGLAPVLTALALLGALLFYWSPYARLLDKEIIIPRPLFDALAAPIMNSITGGADKAAGLAQIAPRNMRGGAELKNISAALDKDFSDQLYQTVNSQINALGRPYKKFIPLGAAITVLFTFKFLGLILIWPMIFLDWLALKILIRLGVVNIKKLPTEKEVLEM